MANHLALATLLEPGDEVVIEQPAYGPLLDVAHYLGARVRRVERRFENDFAISLGEMERGDHAGDRLVVLTNLHNPSGALLTEETLRAIGELAQRVGAQVLVDEAYLDMLFDAANGHRLFVRGKFLVDEQPDKNLRLKQTALRLDSGGAGSGSADVAVRTICSPRPRRIRRSESRSWPSIISRNFASARAHCSRRIARCSITFSIRATIWNFSGRGRNGDFSSPNEKRSCEILSTPAREIRDLGRAGRIFRNAATLPPRDRRRDRKRRRRARTFGGGAGRIGLTTAW